MEVFIMTRLRHWVLFELVFGLLYSCGMIVCFVAGQRILTHLNTINPLSFLLEGIFGILVVALGVGFLFGLVFILRMAMDINPKLSKEERELKSWSK